MLRNLAMDAHPDQGYVRVLETEVGSSKALPCCVMQRMAHDGAHRVGGQTLGPSIGLRSLAAHTLAQQLRRTRILNGT